jgi:predicted metalloprotease with PDZ domain
MQKVNLNPEVLINFFDGTFRGWPEAWGVACSLPKEGEAFLARDLDTLVDSPFELGTFRTHCFHAGRGRGTEPGRPVGSAKGMEGAPPLAGGRGCEFRLVVTGEHPGDEERMVQGARAVVEACGDLFGGFPFENYLFLLTFSPKARGGLEHRDCTSLLADPFTLDRPEGYWDLFLLMAHEFFHVWNVKRMRDAVLGPFDYQRENPTRLLWFHEGFTSFMQYTLVLRAGVAPWSWVARKLASSWTENVTRAGRWEQSLEESSFDAWIRHYKPSEFSSNSTVSYYDMGSMVAWMMDARIRQATGGAQGLDRFFALLWERVGDAPLTDAVLRQTYGELAGEDPGPFWDAHIRGVEPLDPAPIEEAYGLSLAGAAPWERPPVEEGGDPRAQRRARAWSGLEFGGPGNEVRFVVPGSPAAQAGLSYGMEVLAVGGWRTTCRQEVLARLGDHGPGETVEILACDRGRVRAHPLCLGENPNRTYLLSADPGANPRQRAAFQAWTGQAFPTNLPASRGQS